MWKHIKVDGTNLVCFTDGTIMKQSKTKNGLNLSLNLQVIGKLVLQIIKKENFIIISVLLL